MKRKDPSPAREYRKFATEYSYLYYDIPTDSYKIWFTEEGRKLCEELHIQLKNYKSHNYNIILN